MSGTQAVKSVSEDTGMSEESIIRIAKELAGQSEDKDD